ncbi:MAG: non-hydrolyzing UDP-N-acetylglucosamine 2-epimerase, partial [Lactococcus lactis]
VAYFNQIKLAHIEASLRTYNKFSPFPEEMNRQIVGLMADYHFTPTEMTKENLLKEGKPKNQIFVVGNSAIDMFQYTLKDDYTNEALSWQADKKMILVTAHRRENLSDLEEIFDGIAEIADEFRETHKIIYPIHMNPIIREKAQKLLEHSNIKIIDPLDTINFHNVMRHAELILTDSGGIQEEAAFLGIPVLVLRDTTERPEGVLAGTLKLVGTSKENIVNETRTLLTDKTKYERMSGSKNPYGDGTTSLQIVNILNEK